MYALLAEMGDGNDGYVTVVWNVFYKTIVDFHMIHESWPIAEYGTILETYSSEDPMKTSIHL